MFNFKVKKKPTKYSCCDCGKQLSARAKTPSWRRIPADQKRCRDCSARHRALLKYHKLSLDDFEDSSCLIKEK